MTTYTDIILHDTANNFFIPYGLLERLGNVNIVNPTQGQNLTYDETTKNWTNSSTSATVAWGGIIGSISDQADLQNTLTNKADTSLSNLNTNGKAQLTGADEPDFTQATNQAYGTTYVAEEDGWLYWDAHIHTAADYATPTSSIQIFGAINNVIVFAPLLTTIWNGPAYTPENDVLYTQWQRIYKGQTYILYTYNAIGRADIYSYTVRFYPLKNK